MGETVLSQDRCKQMFETLAKSALEYLHIGDVINLHETDSQNWHSLFKEGAQRHEQVELFVEMIEKLNVKDEELDELFRPFYAEAIAEALGAKKITIEW